MADMLIGCNQITWRERGVLTVPVEQALSEIAAAGYEGTPTSPRDNRTAEETIELFSQFGLRPAPGGLPVPFYDKDQRDLCLERAREAAPYMRDVGCTEVFVTPSPLNRMDAAGHVRPEDALSDEAFKWSADILSEVGRITLASGVRSCLHNHVGSTFETRDEINRLYSLVDQDAVFLGPDFGHLAWAGADVVAFCRDHIDHIKSIHLKDIDPEVMEEGRAKAWDYRTFARHGIFTELGEGFVDFPTLFEILKQADFDGWVIVETDITQKPTAFESATISRNYLKSLGI
jgi:inosose dehydratase